MLGLGTEIYKYFFLARQPGTSAPGSVALGGKSCTRRGEKADQLSAAAAPHREVRIPAGPSGTQTQRAGGAHGQLAAPWHQNRAQQNPRPGSVLLGHTTLPLNCRDLFFQVGSNRPAPLLVLCPPAPTVIHCRGGSSAPSQRAVGGGGEDGDSESERIHVGLKAAADLPCGGGPVGGLADFSVMGERPPSDEGTGGPLRNNQLFGGTGSRHTGLSSGASGPFRALSQAPPDWEEGQLPVRGVEPAELIPLGRLCGCYFWRAEPFDRVLGCPAQLRRATLL